MYSEIDWNTTVSKEDEVTVRTPVNIAVIKYWGKRNEKLNVPLHSSLSVTLSMSDMYTETRARRSKETVFCINGKIEPPTKRFDRLINKIRCQHPDAHVNITTHNTFPTAAGLASSASGYAALACTLKLLYQTEGQVSELARLGSGSACRSTAGGFVLWEKGEREDGTDSVARQLFPAEHWPQLRILVCVVCRDEKAVSSTAGMQATVETSRLMSHRVPHVQARIDQITTAIRQRDFPSFGELTMRDSNEMHAVCLDTYPPISYLNDISHQLIRSVHKFNADKGSVRAAYTFDAGPNAVMFCEENDLNELRKRVESEFCGSKGKVTEIVECKIGCGPTVLNS